MKQLQALAVALAIVFLAAGCGDKPQPPNYRQDYQQPQGYQQQQYPQQPYPQQGAPAQQPQVVYAQPQQDNTLTNMAVGAGIGYLGAKMMEGGSQNTRDNTVVVHQRNTYIQQAPAAATPVTPAPTTKATTALPPAVAVPAAKPQMPASQVVAATQTKPPASPVVMPKPSYNPTPAPVIKSTPVVKSSPLAKAPSMSYNFKSTSKR